MHSSRMCTIAAVAISLTMHAPAMHAPHQAQLLPCMPPAMHALGHACPLPCMPSTTHAPPPCMPQQSHSPLPHGQTDACENITFPQLLLRTVKM